MGSIFLLLLLVVALALAFDYINGFHDTANAVATVVSTNVLPGRTAVLMAAVFNFVGALAGTGVAKTIGGDIADPTTLTQTVVAGALHGAIFWNLLTWYYGIPSSSSHALIGGIVGSVWCHEVMEGRGIGSSLWGLVTSQGVTVALQALFLSPLLGLIGGFTIMILLIWLVRSWRPTTVNKSFRWLQLASAGFMAFAHGSNDAQKSMGIILMALIAYQATTVGPAAPGTLAGEIVALGEEEVTFRQGDGTEQQTEAYKFGPEIVFARAGVGGKGTLTRPEVERLLAGSKERGVRATLRTEKVGDAEVVSRLEIERNDIPLWVILSCATAMALGTASGGWRIMKTLGHKIIKLRPIHGFAAETAAALVIVSATAAHAPVSTTHVISASIMGVGASKRVGAVRWGVAKNMLVAWILTIPISALVSALTYLLLRPILGS